MLSLSARVMTLLGVVLCCISNVGCMVSSVVATFRTGTVIDRDTGTPIEGAVALRSWSVNGGLIESTQDLLAISEDHTNERGEFFFWAKVRPSIIAFSRLGLGAPVGFENPLYVFKPGYRLAEVKDPARTRIPLEKVPQGYESGHKALELAYETPYPFRDVLDRSSSTRKALDKERDRVRELHDEAFGVFYQAPLDKNSLLCDVDVDTKGNVYYTDGAPPGRIFMIDPAGKLAKVFTFATGEAEGCIEIEFDKEGHLLAYTTSGLFAVDHTQDKPLPIASFDAPQARVAIAGNDIYAIERERYSYTDKAVLTRRDLRGSIICRNEPDPTATRDAAIHFTDVAYNPEKQELWASYYHWASRGVLRYDRDCRPLGTERLGSVESICFTSRGSAWVADTKSLHYHDFDQRLLLNKKIDHPGLPGYLFQQSENAHLRRIKSDPGGHVVYVLDEARKRILRYELREDAIIAPRKDGG